MKQLLLPLVISVILFSCKKNNSTPTSTLSNGLVANLTFSGNANDQTSNQNHGIVTGATLTTDRFGNNNQAYLFNGSSNYIRINNSSSLDLKESFSISAWISPDDFTLPGVVVWNGDPAFAKDPYILYFSNRPGYNSIGVRKDAGAGNTINEAFAPAQVIFSGVWTHVVGIGNASTREMKLYVNGELMKTVTVPDMSIGYSTSGFWTMIGAAQSSAGIDNYFRGRIDDVRIYNRELTRAEINELFKL